MAVTIVDKPVDLLAGATATLVINYAAVATYRHSLGGVAWSFTSAPAAGDYVKVESIAAVGGAATLLSKLFISNAGPGFRPFPRAVMSPVGDGLRLTLVNGGTVAATLEAVNYVGPLSS